MGDQDGRLVTEAVVQDGFDSVGSLNPLLFMYCASSRTARNIPIGAPRVKHLVGWNISCGQSTPGVYPTVRSGSSSAFRTKSAASSSASAAPGAGAS
eukprot:scaffold29_cov251-Pinguiococcus_pyrenoidosus.AAC.51